MSRERLMNLRNKLLRNGWQIKDASEDASISALLTVEKERIDWHLSKPEKAIHLILRFQLFGEFGGPTEDLNDILYCKVEGRDFKLYFTKINKDRWRRESTAFVAALERPPAPQ